ncbi:HesA/MoeB/ThiF family protein [Granulicella paludicola]|uniref:HesA/MoeB/ThiF family protein n=1 Tax=Granulicella paludicola TaxID=474951 RepID=UPI0021DFFB42|nr:ThiF family adenylyltransferase [Granulicella paludicola]
MALAPFFGRIYSAVGKHVSATRDGLSKALSATRVGLICGDHLSRNSQMIAEMSINLAARLYPIIAITASEPQRVRLQEIARAINPKIEFCDESPGELTVAVGISGPPRSINVSASGWVAELRSVFQAEEGPVNPYAATAAAALAWSEVFRRVFLQRSADRDVSLSLLDFTESSGKNLPLSAASIGEVLFVGVGAVGNAAIWAMSRDEVTSGSLTLVDHETVSLSNLQRYTLAETSDVDEPKVVLAERILRSSHFSVKSIQSTLQGYVANGHQLPTTCISLDNVDGRRTGQALLPRLLVNGWTGDGSLGASWHAFDNGQACLACLYHPHGQGLSAVQQAAMAFGLKEERAVQLWLTRSPLSGEERRHAAKKLGVPPNALVAWKDRPLAELYTDVVCGAVPIDLPGVKNVEVVPLAHQSVLAGALMAAELLKRTQPALSDLAQKEPLISWDDVLQAPPKSWLRPRPRELGCICGDPVYQEVYRERWRNV